MALDKKKYQQA
jgi:uncharacterized protein involved in tolerance to divalent cations